MPLPLAEFPRGCFSAPILLPILPSKHNLMGFRERGNLTVTCYTIPFNICGKVIRTAKTDVCIIHRPDNFVLLVLVEDNTLVNRSNAGVHVVAEAIARGLPVQQFAAHRAWPRSFGFHDHPLHHRGRHSPHILSHPRHYGAEYLCNHQSASRHSNSGLIVCHCSNIPIPCRLWDGGY